MASPTPTTTPLLAEIPTNATNSAYGALSMLLGTWHSPSDAPTGYNVMPVPAGNKEPADFQSKNFYYFEEMTFTAPGEAPNRGQLFQQGCYGVTYEQRVYFAAATTGIGGLSAMPQVPTGTADGANTLVHYENGLWLNTQYEPQPVNAYGSDGGTISDSEIPTQPADMQIVKQVSVPHGNSILSLGTVAEGVAGFPDISATVDSLGYLSQEPFTLMDGIGDPSAVLTAQIDTWKAAGLTATTTTLFVDSDTNGHVTNIPFEQGNADVSRYAMALWIIELSDGSVALQYLQMIPMTFFITATPSQTGTGNDGTATTFQHVTANTLTKVS